MVREILGDVLLSSLFTCGCVGFDGLEREEYWSVDGGSPKGGRSVT